MRKRQPLTQKQWLLTWLHPKINQYLDALSREYPDEYDLNDVSFVELSQQDRVKMRQGVSRALLDQNLKVGSAGSYPFLTDQSWGYEVPARFRQALAMALHDLGWLPTSHADHDNYISSDFYPLRYFREEKWLKPELREGYWVHIFTTQFPTIASLQRFLSEKGEVSVSEWDLEHEAPYFLAHRGFKGHYHVGIAFYGEALHYPGDVWSYAMKTHGRRVPTSPPGWSHDEGFLVPARSRPVALVYNSPRWSNPVALEDLRISLEKLGRVFDLPVVTLRPENPKIRMRAEYEDLEFEGKRYKKRNPARPARPARQNPDYAWVSPAGEYYAVESPQMYNIHSVVGRRILSRQGREPTPGLDPIETLLSEGWVRCTRGGIVFVGNVSDIAPPAKALLVSMLADFAMTRADGPQASVLVESRNSPAQWTPARKYSVEELVDLLGGEGALEQMYEELLRRLN